jgi:hypothetical protein
MPNQVVILGCSLGHPAGGDFGRGIQLVAREAEAMVDWEGETVDNQNQIRLLVTDLSAKKSLRDQYEQEFHQQTERYNAVEMERKRVKRLKH